MKTAPIFISQEEHEKFSIEGRFVPRTTLETIPKTNEDKIRFQKINQDPQNILSIIKFQIDKIIEKGVKREARVFAIEVKKKDGMSWLSQKIYDYLKRQYKTFYYVTFSNRLYKPDRLPVIADIPDLFGRRKFIKAAIRNNLTIEGFLPYKPWFNWFLFILAGIISILIKGAEQVAKNESVGIAEGSNDFFDSYFLLSVGVGVGMSALLKFISTRNSLNEKGASMGKLIDRFRELEVNPGVDYENFIDELAKSMQFTSFPRIVIIDNFTMMDVTTKKIIKKYLSKYSTASKDAEFWIILEPPKMNDSFTNWLVFNKTKLDQNFYSNFVRTFGVTSIEVEEKQRLIQMLGVKEFNVEYEVLSKICEAQPSSNEEILLFLQNIMNGKGDNNFTKLQVKYLYILCVTSAIHQLYFTKSFFRKLLLESPDPNRRNLRGKILTEFLPDAKMSSDELSRAYDGIHQILKKFFNFNNSSEFYIPKEFTTTIIKNFANLGIVSPGLIHLFWTIRWGDNLAKHPLQTFWIEKMTEHIINADLSQIKDNELFIVVRNKYFEITINVIDWSLKTGGYSNIEALLETAYDFCINGSETDLTKVNQLLITSWDVYSILKKESIINIIMNISEYFNEEGPGSIEYVIEEKAKGNELIEGDDLLKAIFFDMIQMDDWTRTQSHFRSNILFGKTRVESINDNIISHSGLIALSIHPLLSRLVKSGLNLEKAKIIYDENHQDLPFKLINRIKKFSRFKERVLRDDSPLDYLTLSMALWNKTVNLIINELVTKEGLKKAVDLNQQITELVEVLFSKGKIGETSKIDQEQVVTNEEFIQTEYFLQTLVTEISLISIVYLVTNIVFYNRLLEYVKVLNSKQLESIKWIDPNDTADDQIINEIKDQINILNELLAFNLPPVKDLNSFNGYKFLESIDDLFTYQSIMWQRFDLESIGALLELRQMQFRNLLSDMLPDYFDELKQFSLSNILLKNYFTNWRNNLGVIAKLVGAGLYAKINSVGQARYFYQATEMIVSQSYGSRLKVEFAIIALNHASSHGQDLSLLAEYVLQYPTKSGRSYLMEVFENTPNDLKFSVFLRWKNSIPNMISPTKEDFEKEILKLPNLVKNETVKTKMRGLIRLNKFMEDIRKHKENINFDEQLSHWQDFKAFFFYADILSQCLSIKGSSSEKILDESYDTLQNPQEDTYNSYIRLAYNLFLKVEHMNSLKYTIDLPIDYMEKEIRNKAQILAPHENFNIYTILNIYRKTNKTDSAVTFWLSEKKKVEMERNLVNIFENGKFFILFKIQCDDLFRKRLLLSKLDISINTYFEIINSSTDEMKNYLWKWEREGKKIPAPINEGQISGHFLTLGSILFNANVIDQNHYLLEIEKINNLSFEHTQKLFQIIIKDNHIPSVFKDIYRNYSNRFRQYTVPKI
ncbi:MAG: hypothetical protein DHS20C18_16080 [Saprospiraceae bacterium]|nr:MAG: hypothetical protein DHS20C18_16080 [Saprospiraceae bacterium]